MRNPIRASCHFAFSYPPIFSKHCSLSKTTLCLYQFAPSEHFVEIESHNTFFCAWLLCYAMLSHFSRVQLCVTPYTATTRLPRPWDSPGKNTGVGCHFLLQCMKVKSQSEVTQSCLTLSDPMGCILPGSSIYGTFQARVLEWGAIAFSPIQYINTLYGI